MGSVLFVKFIPYLGGILGAFTGYILTRGQMAKLRKVRHIGPNFAALLILLETVLFFLVPCSLAIWLLINKLQSVNLDPTEIVKRLQDLADMVQAKTGYDITSPSLIESLAAYLPKIGQAMIGEVSGFAVNMATMFLFLYFMLIWGEKMEDYIYDILPFNEKDKKYVLSEIKIIVTSNAIGIPLLAIIQGAFALVGYLIFKVPSPFIFAFVTCFATMIPMIGTALVWVPLCLYFLLIGDWVDGIGLALYGGLVITNVDNFTRFILQKKMADINPLITIFGVLIGLSLFGFMGIIFGPLLISIFLVCFNMLKVEYIDKKDPPEL
jgi:predicted PurR-regulated permease PerM